jgi:zinc transport system ATP-binding protein
MPLAQRASTPAPAGPLAVELVDVDFAYPGGGLVLAHVDLAVARGEFVAVAGPNGGGKTTLLRVALGLERPTRGRALLFGEPATAFTRHSRVAYLAQRAHVGIDAPVTVREVVTAGRIAVTGLLGRLRSHDRRAIEDAIARVGLSDRGATPLARLSGGQQQRAFIAKALASQPELLVLDEPTTGVDVDAQEALAALLHDLHEDLGVAILYVSHEFGAVERHVERLVLVRGRIVFDGRPSALPAVWHDPSHVHP